MLLSDVCLSVAYIGPKLRTEMPRKTTATHRRVGASGSCSGSVGTCWPWETAAICCRLLGRARRFGTHGGRRGAGAYRGGHPPTDCYIWGHDKASSDAVTENSVDTVVAAAGAFW